MNIRAAIARTYTRGLLAVLTFFDTRLDAILFSLNYVESELARFIARAEDRQERLASRAAASFNRENALVTKERLFRSDLDNRSSELGDEMTRARRVQGKVQKLLS